MTDNIYVDLLTDHDKGEVLVDVVGAAGRVVGQQLPLVRFVPALLRTAPIIC